MNSGLIFRDFETKPIDKTLLMKKVPIIVSIVGLIVCIIFYLWTANSARRKSDDILSRFQEVNKQLASSNDSFLAREGIDALQDLYGRAELKTQIILLIDSLKAAYEAPPQSLEKTRSIVQRRSDIKRLYYKIQEYNQLKKSQGSSQSQDTIMYLIGHEPFDEQKWFSTFFGSVPREVSITYLNFLKDKALKTN